MTSPNPLVLVILDGWGIAPPSLANAISIAEPHNFNNLWNTFPHTQVKASGSAVGLPEGEVGNSEVGHLNLGAGRIVLGDLLRINQSIADGSFFTNPALNAAISHAAKFSGNIHLIGLVTTGIVHSEINHLYTLLELLKNKGVNPQKIFIHAITDGRDSPPINSKTIMVPLLTKLKQENLGQVATLCGRYFAMDRDNRWERTEKAYRAQIGYAARGAPDPISAIDQSYFNGITDEFIEPTIIVNSEGHPLGPIGKNDAVIFTNFRPDRARQLTKAYVLGKLDKVKTSSGNLVPTFSRGPKIENLHFVTMTKYENDLPVQGVAFGKDQVIWPIAQVFAESALKQLHIAETEKYAHVTYFFNGGREEPFPLEERILVNSPKVATYDQVPAMSAMEITRIILQKVDSGSYSLIVANFANPDMLAHTGNLQATTTAIKFTDDCLGQISQAVLKKGGLLVVTADHGNAEQLQNPQTGQIDTEHNINPVPAIFASPRLEGQSINEPGSILGDIAPTILALAKIPKPSQMTGRNLLE